MLFYQSNKKAEGHHSLLAFALILCTGVCVKAERTGQWWLGLIFLVWPASLKAISFLYNLLSLIVPLNIYIFVYIYDFPL